VYKTLCGITLNITEAIMKCVDIFAQDNTEFHTG